MRKVVEQTTGSLSKEEAEMSLAGQTALPGFVHGHIRPSCRKGMFKVVSVFEGVNLEQGLCKGQKIAYILGDEK